MLSALRTQATANTLSFLSTNCVAALNYVAFPSYCRTGNNDDDGGIRLRYALPTVLGVSVLVAVSVARLLKDMLFLGIAILFLSCAGFGMLSARNLQGTPETSLGKIYDIDRSEHITSLPVVISDPHSFMMLSHYAPRELSSRLVYLADPQASLRHLGHDTIDRGILDLRPWIGFHIEEYGRYLEAEPRFFVYVSGGRLGGLKLASH